MSEKLRVAVIGCGGIASAHHLPRYQELPDVEIAAIADADAERLRTAGERFAVRTEE